MNDNVHRCNKIKMTIEKKINNIYQDKEFFTQNFNQQDSEKIYNQKISELKLLYDQINQDIDDFERELSLLQTQYDSMVDYPTQQKIVLKEKLANLNRQQKEFQKDSRKAYLYRLSKLQREKQNAFLFGTRKSQSDQNGISILIQEKDILLSSHKQTDELLSTSRNILSSFKFQNESLKTIQKKTLTVLNEMGLSNTLSKLIERRSRNDCYILIFCFFLLLVIVFFLYFYMRPYVRGY